MVSQCRQQWNMRRLTSRSFIWKANLFVFLCRGLFFCLSLRRLGAFALHTWHTSNRSSHTYNAQHTHIPCHHHHHHHHRDFCDWFRPHATFTFDLVIPKLTVSCPCPICANMHQNRFRYVQNIMFTTLVTDEWGEQTGRKHYTSSQSRLNKHCTSSQSKLKNTTPPASLD